MGNPLSLVRRPRVESLVRVFAEIDKMRKLEKQRAKKRQQTEPAKPEPVKK